MNIYIFVLVYQKYLGNIQQNIKVDKIKFVIQRKLYNNKKISDKAEIHLFLYYNDDILYGDKFNYDFNVVQDLVFVGFLQLKELHFTKFTLRNEYKGNLEQYGDFKITKIAGQKKFKLIKSYLGRRTKYDSKKGNYIEDSIVIVQDKNRPIFIFEPKIFGNNNQDIELKVNRVVDRNRIQIIKQKLLTTNHNNINEINDSKNSTVYFEVKFENFEPYISKNNSSEEDVTYSLNSNWQKVASNS